MPFAVRLSLLTAIAALVAAQPQEPKRRQSPAQEGEVTFSASTQRVLLHVSVLDRQGKLLTNIPQSAFKVMENGVEQKIRLFRREDIPVSMGLIIDNSGSMRGKVSRVNAAALTLVRESNPDDEVFIFNFNDDVYPDQEFTNDTKKLEQALERVEAKGGTAMRNAVWLGIDYAKEKGKRDKKVLIVVTDGEDTASAETTLEKLVRKAQLSEVLIYSIGLLDADDLRGSRAAKRALKSLAEASGGMDFYPRNLEEVEKITPQIAHEIRNQYLLEYSPSNENLDGRFRTIKVTVSGQRGATVRHRNGYYATPITDRAKPTAQLSH